MRETSYREHARSCGSAVPLLNLLYRGCLRPLSPKLVLLNLDRCHTALRSHNSSPRHQLQRYLAVELRRPTDGQLHPAARNQEPIGCEQHAIAAHVYRLARTDLVTGLPIQDAVANVALDRETVRSPPVSFVFRIVQSLVP